MENAIIVARCSTNEVRQDVTRQTYDLYNKFSTMFNIVEKLEYYKSGESNDKELDEIIQFAINNNIQHILFSEISRISRRVIETLVFIEKCTKQKINVYIDNYKMNSLNIDKSENLMTQVMLQIGATFASMELKQTHSRLNSGRAKHIANGGRVGRKPETKLTKEQFLEKHKDVIKFLRQGQSVRNVMKLTTKSSGTVMKAKQMIYT